MGTATFIKNMGDNFAGDARLYRLDVPIRYHDWVDDELVSMESSHVIVSGAYATFTGPETFIFPSDESGNVICWLEQDGSFQGSIDHAEALRGAGYEVSP